MFQKLKRRTNRHISRKYVPVFPLALLCSSLSWAQFTPQQIPGGEFYTETQLSLATAIQFIVDADETEGGYTNFSGVVGTGPLDYSSIQEQRMVEICADYNGNVWANTTPTPAQAREIASVLDVITHEEVGANGAMLTDTSTTEMASIVGRMQELRGAGPNLALYNENRLAGGAAGDEFSRLSYFINGNYGTGSKDATNRETGFDFDSYGIVGGVDYRISDELFAGVALSLGQSSVDIDRNLGESDTDSYSLTFYGSYYLDDSWYLDAVLGFSLYDYDNTRNLLLSTVPIVISGTDQFIDSSTDGDTFDLSVGAGYLSELRGWQATYSGRIDFTDGSIDGYTEDQSNSLALTIGKQDVESLQLVLGAQFSKSISQKWGTYNPFVGIEIHQEFEDDTRVVTAQYAYDRFNNTFSFTSDDADSNYAVLSGGASFVLSNGRQAFVNLDTVVGLEDVTSFVLTGGMRFEN